MPHLHIEEFKYIQTPASLDGVEFNFIVDNTNFQNDTLISASVDGDEFFLVAKKDEGKHLLKSDKLTRPASVHNVHKALLAYSKIATLKILASNVPNREQNVHLQELNALKNIDFFVTNFPTNNKIRIEVGFGSGRHLLHQAMNNPEILFIGLEIHRASIEQVLKQINIQKINNILILDYDARLFMEFVPSNRIDKIYVHFPVPWDKKPHRRVISKPFIREARRVLEVDGTLELRTDSENYYAYSYETFISFQSTILQINKNKDIAISSKYEDRWKRMEKNIYDLTMINDELSQELSIEGNFEFQPCGIDPKEVLKLHKTTKKFEDAFVHFERIYIKGDKILLRVSLGSFDRPEHTYILIDKNKTSYYPKEPLKSTSNLVAHKYINGVLNG